MNATFVDTFYYLALVNADDAGHEKAMAASRNRQGRLVTTQWIMLEVADALADPIERPKFLAILDAIGNDPTVALIEANDVTLIERAKDDLDPRALRCPLRPGAGPTSIRHVQRLCKGNHAPVARRIRAEHNVPRGNPPE